MKQTFVFPIILILFINNALSQPKTEIFNNKIIINTHKEYSFLDTNWNVVVQNPETGMSKSFAIDRNYSTTYPYNVYSWDMQDSFWYNVKTYSDRQDLTYTKLMFYNLNGIEYTAEKKRIDYRNKSWENITCSYRLPLDNYMVRIRFRDDTLKGPLFFDLQAKSDSLLLYIYVEDYKKIEIWNFNYFHLLQKNLTGEQRSKLMSLKEWSLVRSNSALLSAPFRVVHTHGQDYLITTEGDIYHIGTKALEPAGKLPSLPGKGILVIDKGKDAVYFMEERWMVETQKRPLEEVISREAVRILKEK